MDFEAVLQRWVNMRRCICIAGAGLSVASGVPDFRSPDGIYQLIAACSSTSAARFSEPQEIFDSAVFRDEPELLYAMAPRLFAPLWAAKPSRGHGFLAALCRLDRLQRLYSQNVDGLEAQAGVAMERLVLCHGTLLTASCMRCGRKVSCGDPALRACLEAGSVATCRGTGGPCPEARQTDDGWVCGTSKRGSNSRSGHLPLPILKPDAVFFREPLPSAFHDAVAQDFRAATADPAASVGSEHAAGGPEHSPDGDSRVLTAAKVVTIPDACLVIGSRLAVRPVADLPHLLPPSCWKVLINRERLQATGSRVAAGSGGEPSSSPAAAVGSKRARKVVTSSSARPSNSTASASTPAPPVFDAEFIGEADVTTHMLLQVLQQELRRQESGSAASDVVAASGSGAGSGLLWSAGSSTGSPTSCGAAPSATSNSTSLAAASPSASTAPHADAASGSLASFGFTSLPAPPGHWHVHGHDACVRGADGDADADSHAGFALGQADGSSAKGAAYGAPSSACALGPASGAGPTVVVLVRSLTVCAAAEDTAAAAPRTGAGAGAGAGTGCSL